MSPPIWTKVICTIISVSTRYLSKDGKKYNYSKAEQQRLRDISDRLCREYGLSVILHKQALKICLPQYQHFTRLDTLDDRSTPENIKHNLGAWATFGNKRSVVNFASELPEKLRVYVPFQRTSPYLSTHQYPYPISFEREISKTVYTVNAHFSNVAAESLEQKALRFLTKA